MPATTAYSVRVSIMSSPATEAGVCAEVWRFIAMALAEPAADSAELISEQPYQPEWLTSALGELATVALDVWQGEHTRLFTFPAVCPPFASTFLEDGVLDGHRAGELERFYGQYDLAIQGLPADYLGTMAEFIGFFLEKEDTSAAADFYREYLADWLDRFCDCLERHAEFMFYRELAGEIRRQAEGLRP